MKSEGGADQVFGHLFQNKPHGPVIPAQAGHSQETNPPTPNPNPNECKHRSWLFGDVQISAGKVSLIGENSRRWQVQLTFFVLKMHRFVFLFKK